MKHLVKPSFVSNFTLPVRLAMWGPGIENSNFSAVSGDYLEGVAAAEDFFRARIDVLRVGFKNSESVNFGALRPPDDHVVVGQRGSIRVQRVADVAFTPVNPENPQPVVMAMLNADCPGVFAVEHNDEGHVVGCWFAHAGLDCLLPKEPNKYTVLETIWEQRQALGLRGKIDFYFGGGIGPCCYGLESILEVKTRLMERCRSAVEAEKFIRQSVLGPRCGQASVSLGELFKAEVAKTFSRTALLSVSIDDTCTACLGISEGVNKRLLWSHVYDGGANKVPLNPRNFTCFSWRPLPPRPSERR